MAKGLHIYHAPTLLAWGSDVAHRAHASEFRKRHVWNGRAATRAALVSKAPSRMLSSRPPKTEAHAVFQRRLRAVVGGRDSARRELFFALKLAGKRFVPDGIDELLSFLRVHLAPSLMNRGFSSPSVLHLIEAVEAAAVAARRDGVAPMPKVPGAARIPSTSDTPFGVDDIGRFPKLRASLGKLRLASVPASARAPAPAPPQPEPEGRMILVEERAFERATLARSLMAARWDVTPCRGLEDAMQALRDATACDVIAGPFGVAELEQLARVMPARCVAVSWHAGGPAPVGPFLKVVHVTDVSAEGLTRAASEARDAL